MSDSELIELGKREIDRIGLASASDIEDGCVFRVPKSYPIYDSDYGDYLQLVKDFVGQFDNFQTIGRNGLHRYNNQDHAMLTGMLAVRNAVEGEANDLWSVNAEQEYHEEIREERDMPLVTEVVQDALVADLRQARPGRFRTVSRPGLWADSPRRHFAPDSQGRRRRGTEPGPAQSLLPWLPGYPAREPGRDSPTASSGVSWPAGCWPLSGTRRCFCTAPMTYRGAEFRALRRLLDYIH